MSEALDGFWAYGKAGKSESLSNDPKWPEQSTVTQLDGAITSFFV